ncbi:MAG: hypothetical protein ACFFC7_09070 [Candidatus Hermodarchaeota archaeon]
MHQIITFNKVTSEYAQQVGFPGITIVTFIALLMFTFGIAMMLFSSVWFLLDTGNVYSNKEKVENENLDQPIEGRAGGGWYLGLLKGYAGIGVIFSYYQLVFLFFLEGSSEGLVLSPIMIVNILIWFPLMLIIAIAAIPALILLDLIKEHRINYIRNWANRLGITENVEIIMQEKG